MKTNEVIEEENDAVSTQMYGLELTPENTRRVLRQAEEVLEGISVESKNILNNSLEERASTKIESDTFTPTGKRLGMGCWGCVDEYKDPTGQSWAIKSFNPNETAVRQMKQRRWTEEDVMRNEAVPLDAGEHNVVPRIIERDKKGKLFVGMPVYERTLESVDCFDIDSKGERRLRVEKLLEILKDISKGLNYLHGRSFGWHSVKRAHGDLKKSNVFMKNGHAYIGDLGSSTCISIGGSGSVRGEHGDINYRAPECFDEEAKPSTRADIWGLGAIAYNLATYQGIYDGMDIHKLSGEELAKSINKKLKKLPRAMRGFVKKCLAVDEDKRLENGYQALSELEELIIKQKGFGSLKKYLKWAVPLVFCVGAISLSSYKAAVYEPQKLEMPSSQKVVGMLYPNQDNGKPIEFEIENTPFEKKGPFGMMSGGMNQNAKKVTDNRVIAYLTKTYGQAQMARGGSGANDYQQQLFMQITTDDERRFGFHGLTGTPWPIWAKSIEYALTQSKAKDGKVDLEDTMAISVLGVSKVAEAKRIAGSEDWKNYKSAKHSDGSSVISERDMSFIEDWRNYYLSDSD